MLQPQQVIELEIETIAFGGAGVARAPNGMAVFVPYTAPGDTVRARLETVKKRYAQAVLEEVLAPGPARVAPRDPLYTRHAATQYEHIDYAAQLEIKHAQLRDQLARLGGIPAESYAMHAIEPSPEPFHYRNKLTVHACETGGWGFFAHDNRTVVPIGFSTLAREPLNAALAGLGDAAVPKGRGHKRPACTLRVDARGEVAHFVGSPPPGMPDLVERLNGLELRVPPDSFFQVNVPVAERLFTQVAQWVRDVGAPVAVDAYCGVGAVSAHLPAEQRVEAFDSDAAAVAVARRNAEALDQGNRHFAVGTDHAVFDDVLGRTTPGDTVVVLDPPRTGCAAPVVEALNRARCRAVVMVSCNPSTLARDLARLCGEGGAYRVAEVAAFDMFPQTAHVEAAALLHGEPG